MSTGATSLDITLGTTAAARPRESSVNDRGKPAVAWWIESSGLLAVALELVLVDLILFRLDLFTPAFRRIVVFAGPAFLVNHFVPKAHRMRAFAVMCAIALLLFLGGSPDAFWLPTLAVERSLPILVAGGLLAGVCVLPIRFWMRVVLLAALGGLIAMFRAGLYFPPSLTLIWPILASLFMFRVIVFCYHTSTMPKRPTLAESFAYFFLVPNVCIGLFPVVDFKRFVRSHYEIDALDIYQRGARMIGKGIVQLIVYRLIQQLVSIGASDVASGRDLAQYVLSNAFLYVKVSGQFHVFIGMLLLFGFNLPDTNRRYFLASSFTDYWRRVNVYWKDFIMTVFYYPAYFRMKRFGATTALVLATFWSFFITWALHLYQTWWLKGSAQITGPDVLFWSILAVLVLANSLWETNRGRLRKLATSTYSVRNVLGLTLRTAGTFSVVCVLWSLWSASTVAQWIGLWRYTDRTALVLFGLAVAGVMAATIVLEVLPPVIQKRIAASRRERNLRTLGWHFALTAAPLVVVLLASSGTVQASFDSAAVQPWKDAINTGDSMVDDLVVHNGGYYEQLTNRDLANGQVWEIQNFNRLPPDVFQGPDLNGATMTEAMTWQDIPIRPVNDLRFFEFEPNIHVRAGDWDFSTNQFGMRDRARTVAKAPGVVRIAVLGSSHVMGWGVPSDKTFEAVLEQRLNQDAALTAGGVRFEVLNFAVYSRGPLSELSAIESWVKPFRPDVVLLVTHPVDLEWMARDLARAVRERVPVSYPILRDVASDAMITPRTNKLIADERLAPYRTNLLAWCYRQIAGEANGMGALGGAVYLPTPLDLPLAAGEVEKQEALIGQAGLDLIDLTHIWDHQDVPALIRQPDHHINARAHAMLAEALYDTLRADRDVLARVEHAAAPQAGPVASTH